MFYILSYLGQIAGYLLGWNSPEEMKQGEKYFIILKRIFFIFIVGYLIFLTFSNTTKLDILFFIIGLALSFLIKYEYLGFGFIPIDWISSTFIFLYGLPYGSLLYIQKNKKQFLYNLIFFVPLIICWYFRLDLSSLALGFILTRFK